MATHNSDVFASYMDETRQDPSRPVPESLGWGSYQSQMNPHATWAPHDSSQSKVSAEPNIWSSSSSQRSNVSHYQRDDASAYASTHNTSTGSIEDSSSYARNNYRMHHPNDIAASLSQLHVSGNNSYTRNMYLGGGGASVPSMTGGSVPGVVGASSGSTGGGSSAIWRGNQHAPHGQYPPQQPLHGYAHSQQLNAGPGNIPPGFMSPIQTANNRGGGDNDSRSYDSRSMNSNRRRPKSGGKNNNSRAPRGSKYNNQYNSGNERNNRNSNNSSRNNRSSQNYSAARDDDESNTSYTDGSFKTFSTRGGGDDTTATNSKASSEAIRMLMKPASPSASLPSRASTLTASRLVLDEPSSPKNSDRPILPSLEDVFQDPLADDECDEDDDDLPSECGSKKRDWLLRMNRRLSEIPVGELDPTTMPLSAIMNSWAKTKSAQGASMVEMWLKRAQEEHDAGNTRVVPTTKMYTMAGKWYFRIWWKYVCGQWY
jgi:hypothetical protein